MIASRSVFLAAERTREELDADYAPSRFVPDMGEVVRDWSARTAATRAAHGERAVLDLAYDQHPRARIDLYRADVAGPAPLHIFIHGGFWQNISKAESGFIADGWTARDVHVAVLDYALAPEVSLQTIVRQVRTGLRWLLDRCGEFGVDPSRIIISGHSAGGHLAAMSQIAGDGFSPTPVRGLVLVSGVFELLPITRSYVNDKLGLAEADAPALSPARLLPSSPVPLVVAVGEKEPVAFQEQSRLQASVWQKPGTPSPFMLVARRNHFDLLDDLANVLSPLGRASADLLELP